MDFGNVMGLATYASKLLAFVCAVIFFLDICAVGLAAIVDEP